MKDLKPIKGKRYIAELIAQGETECQDFKYTINDARKIARSLSAFSNFKGGRLLIGVKDNGVIAGVKNEEDIFVVQQAADLYCRPAVELDFRAFSCGEDGIVIQATVSPATSKPVCAQEPDLRWRAYYRAADENISAHPLMVRAWRHQASEQPSLLRMDGIEGHLLSHISEKGEVAISEALKVMPASRRTVEQAIINLFSLSIIDFNYNAGNGFSLILKEKI